MSVTLATPSARSSRPTLPARTREKALLTGLIAILLLAVVGWTVNTPYIALGPGPVTDTLGAPGGTQLIQVKGLKTYPTSGKLELTTVTVSTKLKLFEALSDWMRDDLAVVPREYEYPKDKTDKQVATQNQNDMQESRADAVTVVLSKLHLLNVVVMNTVKGSPAAAALRPDDQIVAINAVPVFSANDIRVQITKVKVGQRVAVRFVRNGATHVVVLRTFSTSNDGLHPAIGVLLEEKNKPGTDVQIVGLDQVGGPSAGMMFALGIYDTLTPGELTGGQIIAGTGTIDPTGAVGPIGGISLKMIGARRSGASWFLTPADNCAEAKQAIPAGLHLAKVATFDQALAAVRAIAAGRTDIPSC